MQKYISLTKDVRVTEEGWVGKPKGILQVLYKRRFLDPSASIQLYTLDGKKDEYRHVIEGTSLNTMMNSCVHLQNEEKLLQYHGRLLSVLVDCTPKCHPEISGEGIEYAWGAEKLYYRRLRIAMKRTKNKFRKSIKMSTDRNTILTIERKRKFSKRAR